METNEITILKALEKVHNISKKSKLKLDRYKDSDSEIQHIANYFQINEIQSIILANFFGLACLAEIEAIEVIDYLGMKKIEFFPFINEVKFLSDKNILEKTTSKNFSKEDYSISNAVLSYIIENKFIPEHLIQLQTKVDSFHEFLNDMDTLSRKKDNKVIGYSYFVHQFKQLLEKNRKYKLINFAVEHLEPIDSFVFFDVIIDAIASGTNNFNSGLQSTVADFTCRNSDTFTYVTNFLEGKTKLNSMNLVEKDKSQFGNSHKIQLTEKAIKLLYEMEQIKITTGKNLNNNLIYPDKIQTTNLFYNPAEQVQLEPVLKSMSHHSFTNLQRRLKQNNMPIGVTALLYGAPGTGKTETVYQLAKKYSRPIYKVEIAETKSMWFGESQKLVKKIFTDYHEYKKHEKVCPILLFNEADAVIGKRKNAGSTSTSDTENAIQNILLEELENFDGILFATSNLVNNLDPAFERRFLFKIKFDVPCTENAAKIWKNKLPQISSKQAQFLAVNFKFSGGEMENIARKCIMEEVVLGNKVAFEKIIAFCENEKWDKNSSASKIGF